MDSIWCNYVQVVSCYNMRNLNLIQQYNLQRVNCLSKSMRNQGYPTAKVKRVLSNGLTHHQLDFLLPSSKKIMLVNSSIKYNALKNQNGVGISNEEKGRDELRISEDIEISEQNIPISLKNLQFRQKNNVPDESTVQKDKQFKIIAQSSKHLAIPSMRPQPRPVSAVHFQTYGQEEAKYLTSLNNIIPSGGKDAINRELNSKEELIKRICKLENLVYDIINGKIIIPRFKDASNKMSKTHTKKTKLQISEPKKEERSNTQGKTVPNKTAKSLTKSKAKIKIAAKQDKAEIKKQLPHSKAFMIKKRNQLKLTADYQPIRNTQDTNPEPILDIKDSFKYESPITDSSEKGCVYSKLKFKVSLMPNIITL